VQIFNTYDPAGSGIIWNQIAFAMLVIPAQAGIQSVDGDLPIVYEVDSRLHRND